MEENAKLVNIMDFMDVYTPYGLFFVALITFCIMASALFISYITIMVKKGLLFWGYLSVQITLLVLLFGKLLEMVSPTEEIMNIHLAVQKIGVLLVPCALLMFLSALRKQNFQKRLLWYSYIAAAAAFACTACILFRAPDWVFDSSPVFAFVILNTFIFYQRANIFVELSDMSIDSFMERIGDAILIFDRSKKLMDYNHNAKTMFPFIDFTRTIDGFYSRLKGQLAPGSAVPIYELTVSGPAEIALRCPGGTRYFLHSLTAVNNKKNVQVATILTFHDVTEKNLLLEELEAKNARLNELNDALKDFIKVAQRLEDEKEKNRAVMEIQQTIGQSIAELLIGLQALNTIENGQDDTVKKWLDEMIESCRTVMSDIRKAVERLTLHYDERK